MSARAACCWLSLSASRRTARERARSMSASVSAQGTATKSPSARGSSSRGRLGKRADLPSVGLRGIGASLARRLGAHGQVALALLLALLRARLVARLVVQPPPLGLLGRVGRGGRLPVRALAVEQLAGERPPAGPRARRAGERRRRRQRGAVVDVAIGLASSRVDAG